MSRKRLLYLALIILFVALAAFLSLPAGAADANYLDTQVYTSGFDYPEALKDSDYNTYTTAWEQASITLSRSDQIHGLYIIFDRIPESWQLIDPATGKSVSLGNNAFLHEYVDVAALFGEEVRMLDMIFPAGTVLADIYAFSAGNLPDWVQMWQPPCEKADLLLISSHSDDEQLFFAGVLPIYAGEKGLNVQVAYIVQHFQLYNEQIHNRPHEQLNGLWAVGVTNYPVMSDFPDLYSESLEGAISVFNSVGVTENDFSAYITELIRRFKPLVVVSHDVNGEYSHGTHIYCTKTLRDVLEISDDPDVHPESAEKWGTWTPEKVYLHLYPENQIVLDLDAPLSAFDGKTAFEMTQYGFSFHKSQHWTWFNNWIYGSADAPITKATQINAYSPCNYGLYYTEVGNDVQGGDFFENIIPYAMRNQTDSPETDPYETVSPETQPSESERIESAKDTTDPSETSPLPSLKKDDERSIIFKGLTTILALAIAAVIIVYIASVIQLNRRRKRRGNRRR